MATVSKQLEKRSTDGCVSGIGRYLGVLRRHPEPRGGTNVPNTTRPRGRFFFQVTLSLQKMWQGSNPFDGTQTLSARSFSTSLWGFSRLISVLHLPQHFHLCDRRGFLRCRYFYPSWPYPFYSVRHSVLFCWYFALHLCMHTAQHALLLSMVHRPHFLKGALLPSLHPHSTARMLPKPASICQQVFQDTYPVILASSVPTSWLPSPS